MARVGLVLTGGGARAAYQVGVLRALAEIEPGRRAPFDVISGVSAGAINGVSVATGANDFDAATARLQAVWASLTPDSVYRTDAKTLFSIGRRWVGDLAAGAFLGGGRINYLLDTSPLRRLLEEKVPIARLADQIQSGVLRGVAVSATNYLTGTAITFFDGLSGIPEWARSTRLGRRERITIDHVLASSAIPIFFPPVQIEGIFYGDGCVRMTAPISPAIHLGAEKIVAVGIRFMRPTEMTDELNRTLRRESLALSDVAGTLLNAVFLDSLESDLERLERVNRTLSFLRHDPRAEKALSLRRIPVLALRPSKDLGKLASKQFERFPRTLRYLLKGIGATGDGGWDLLSYLAFEPIYVGTLMDLGYHDTLARRAEIQAFFSNESA